MAGDRAARLERILALFGQLQSLDTEIDFEYSLKAVHGDIFENRFLLGVNRQALSGNPDERLCAICANIGMPSALLAAFRQAMSDANHVYFGVEKDTHSLMFKAYLEFRDRIERDLGDAPAIGRSFRLFAGFKWDTFSPDRQAVTHYDWYPSLPLADLLERMRTALGAGGQAGFFDIAQGIAEQAAAKIPHGDIQYLEVSEAGNPRRSFDLNLYKSGLRVEDLATHMRAAQHHYGIDAERFDSLYRRIGTERFGHLAGGIDRENRDFMTVYYGLRRFHSRQLGSAAVAA